MVLGMTMALGMTMVLGMAMFSHSLTILNVAFGLSCFSLSVIPAFPFCHSCESRNPGLLVVRRKKPWILDY